MSERLRALEELSASRREITARERKLIKSNGALDRAWKRLGGRSGLEITSGQIKGVLISAAKDREAWDDLFALTHFVSIDRRFTESRRLRKAASLTSPKDFSLAIDWFRARSNEARFYIEGKGQSYEEFARSNLGKFTVAVRSYIVCNAAIRFLHLSNGLR